MSRIAQARFALVLAAALVVPSAAQAEGGLFGAIMNFLGGGRATQEPAPLPSQPLPSAPGPLDLSGFGNQTIPPSRGGPQVAYCVRTCDGRYFPLARSAGGPNAMAAKICSALCPTAETKIYTGGNIESAVASDGSRYTSLKNAFIYRERFVDGCSCNGGDGAGNAAIEIKSDPTLRPGDIVVTTNGPMVFKGGKSELHQCGDFAPAADNAQIPAKLRDRVKAIKVARPNGAPVASPQDVAPAPPPAPKPASPAETAAKIFDFRDFDAAALRGTTAMGYNGRP